MKILVTGAGGFIGSCVAVHWAKQGHDIIVTDSSEGLERSYLRNARIYKSFELNDERLWHEHYDLIIHNGAISNTAEKDWNKLIQLNFEYTKKIWNYSLKHKTPLIYASSASTYGDGRLGFSDDHEKTPPYMPLNLYGKSKHDFDCWALKEKSQPEHWYGLKYFNVYGPNEYHKGGQASVVFHGFNQITKTGKHILFKSHRPDVKDGEQKRDFIFVKDLIDVMDFLVDKKPKSGIYNLGTGKARSFLDLSNSLFAALSKEKSIEWVETPLQYREHYQYFTEAEMNKLRHVGYTKSFTSLEEGVKDYVQNYLLKNYSSY